MAQPTSTPTQIPGLGLPADPATGLPIGFFPRDRFVKWVALMIVWTALTAALYAGLSCAFTADPNAPPAAPQQAPAPTALSLLR